MRVASFLTLLLMLVVGPAAAQTLPAFNPTMPPSLPPAPPPRVVTPPPPAPSWIDPPAEVNPGDTQVFVWQLNPGWTVMSFPVGRMVSVEGLDRNLYRYAGGRFFPVDPVHAPSSIDPRLGYAVYVDAPTTVRVTAVPNNWQVDTVPLSSGWNLIGAPSTTPIPWATVTASQGATVRPLSQVASPVPSSWISSRVFTGGMSLDVLAPGATLAPWQATWVFAWHPAILDLAVATPGPVPSILSVMPSSVGAGQRVTVVGSGFGSAPGAVMIAGLPVPPGAILSWTNTQISLAVPDYARSGNLVVLANGMPSLPFILEVRPTNQIGGLGQIWGRVETMNGQPLVNAQVMADTGQTAVTLDDGSFTLSGVQPGIRVLTTTMLGFERSFREVPLEPGESERVLIDLQPVMTAPSVPSVGDWPPTSSTNGGMPPLPALAAGPLPYAPPVGTLSVVADAYDDGYHTWYASRIEVQEWNNPGKRWRQDWPSYLGDSYSELDCDDAQIGRTYQIRLTWKSPDGGQRMTNTVYRTMYTTDQTVTIDSPYE